MLQPGDFSVPMHLVELAPRDFSVPMHLVEHEPGDVEREPAGFLVDPRLDDLDDLLDRRHPVEELPVEPHLDDFFQWVVFPDLGCRDLNVAAR